MPYFFILPVFILATLVLIVASVICRIVTRLRWAYPYAWRALVWSVAGFVVANIPVLALFLVPLGLEQAGVSPEAAGRPGLLLFAAALFIGPFVASVVGYGGGAMVGLWLALRAARARPGSGHWPA